MKPDAVFVGNRANFRQWIERAKTDTPGRADNDKGVKPVSGVFGDLVTQICRIHPFVGVGGNSVDGIHADAAQVGDFFDPRMGFPGCVGD
jgi:hypothetical protein